MASHCHLRSISLLSRSHPSTLKIQEELNNLRTWKSSSTPNLGMICNHISGLQELYKGLDELVGLPSIQQALSCHKQEKWFDELVDRSIRIVDICGITRDVMSQFMENVQDVQSALRRKGDACIESSTSNYICSRKKLKKEVKKLLSAAKTIYNRTGASLLLDQDHQLSTVIRMLREVNEVTISIFQSLLSFLSTQVLKPKPTRWSLVSKFMSKREVSSEEKHGRAELESIDFALTAVSSERVNLEKMQIVLKGLGTLEISIKGLDNGLECMFRQLIRTRASLLNIISQ